MESYGWVRYWAPHDKSPVLGDWGFLSEPTGPLGMARNPGLVSTTELPERRCVVLLGESGMGKSRALSGAIPDLECAAEGRGEAFFRLDLREIGSEASLQTDLLEARIFAAMLFSELRPNR
jgi:hypothetical protein